MGRFVLQSFFVLSAAIAFGKGLDTPTASASGNDAEVLHVLFMRSSSPRFNSSAAGNAVQAALDDVNSNQSLLQGYELQVAELLDTQVSTSIT